VNSFTIMLANELKNTKFRVNSVTPGHTATDLNDFKGTKSVQEGVKPIVRLVTLNSDYVTGEFLKEGGTVTWYGEVIRFKLSNITNKMKNDVIYF
jgi:NAD(P)-dependent dehydrogenase (short-subunit alcohol dehydrogenase family)